MQHTGRQVHERHLTGNFLLGVLRSVLAQRPIHMTNLVNTHDEYGQHT